MSAAPLLTVVVPMLNEAADIAGCLEAVTAQTYPRDRLEVLLVDGGSTDGTVEVALATAAALGVPARVVANPRRRQAPGLNCGLAEARGEFLIRVDARSRPGPEHCARVAAIFERRPEVGVVGGGQRPIERSASRRDRMVARALDNRWTTGLARYRRSTVAGPADTVWLGAYRVEALRSLGGWDESLALNEDYELNERCRRNGAVVWFDPELTAGYLPRRSVRALGRQYLAYGRTKGRRWAEGTRPAARQVVLVVGPPLAAVAGIAAARRVGWPLTLAAFGAAALLVDATGSRRVGDGPVERTGALGVGALVAGSWWLGVVEGLGRGLSRRDG